MHKSFEYVKEDNGKLRKVDITLVQDISATTQEFRAQEINTVCSKIAYWKNEINKKRATIISTGHKFNAELVKTALISCLDDVLRYDLNVIHTLTMWHY